VNHQSIRPQRPLYLASISVLFSAILVVTVLAASALSSSSHSVSAAEDTVVSTYMPFLIKPLSDEPLPPPIAITVTESISVPVLEASLSAEGRWLALNKIGFHTGIYGNLTGLDEWMQALDAAGIPIFLKTADNAEPVYKAQELAKVSGVPHTLVYRKTSNNDYDYDVPNYELEPTDAALIHWQEHKIKFPPELDPSMVWIETVNEVHSARSEWLAEFALETAKLAIADGFKWAAFGWSSGEPRLFPEDLVADWESPAMLKFLRFAANNPDQVAIALHEYSFDQANVGLFYPYRVGRFQKLFEICDKHGIRRPTVLITEWGWQDRAVPEPEKALTDIAWASWLYAAYPEIKGAAIWYLGGGFDKVADQTQKLIAPVQDYSLTNYFSLTPGAGRVDPSLFLPPSPDPPPPGGPLVDRPGR